MPEMRTVLLGRWCVLKGTGSVDIEDCGLAAAGGIRLSDCLNGLLGCIWLTTWVLAWFLWAPIEVLCGVENGLGLWKTRSDPKAGARSGHLSDHAVGLCGRRQGAEQLETACI